LACAGRASLQGQERLKRFVRLEAALPSRLENQGWIEHRRTTRRRVAAELIADLERVYARKKAANKELTELVAATGTGLLSIDSGTDS
jgi:hypothetical protein